MFILDYILIEFVESTERMVNYVNYSKFKYVYIRILILLLFTMY